MGWVKSSQRRNSPRINTFQQENRGKERNWFGRRRMWFGAQNFATSSLPLPLPSSLSHLFIFDSSLSLFIFALSLHSPASASGIDLWLHAVCFLLWNWLDMYVMLCNYKSVTLAVCDLNVLNNAPSCVPFRLFSNEYRNDCLAIILKKVFL